MMRDKLKTYAAAIGHARAEIFPKQEKINIERGDVGSFLNLPYHNLDNTVRYAFDSDGNAMLFQFKLQQWKELVAVVHVVATAGVVEVVAL